MADHSDASHKIVVQLKLVGIHSKMRVKQKHVKEKREGNDLDNICICADSIMRK
jgi:hypothetical protein